MDHLEKRLKNRHHSEEPARKICNLPHDGRPREVVLPPWVSPRSKQHTSPPVALALQSLSVMRSLKKRTTATQPALLQPESRSFGRQERCSLSESPKWMCAYGHHIQQTRSMDPPDVGSQFCSWSAEQELLFSPVRPSRPASAHSFSTPSKIRQNLTLTSRTAADSSPLALVFRDDGVHLLLYLD